MLDHGLPDLPPSLGDDDEVPVSCWAGGRYGVVLFKSWSAAEDDDFEGVSDPAVNIDHYCYRRVGDEWVATGAGGGVAGPEADPLAPLDVPADFAAVGGSFSDNDIDGVTGIVGTSATVLELTSDVEGVVRRPIEAPTSWFVICHGAEERLSLRILDAGERPLLERPIMPRQG